MRYQIIVFRKDFPNQQVVVDREFEFSESSHKVVDIINQAVDQAEAEGGRE